MALYGLLDADREWSATPDDGLNESREWSTDYLYLLNEAWEWEAAPAGPVLEAPYRPIISLRTRRPTMTLVSV